jgi:hypothetical protein
MATKVNERFLFDSSFFDDIIKNNRDILPELATKLTYITSKAVGILS